MAAQDRSPDASSRRSLASSDSPDKPPTQLSAAAAISLFRSAVSFNARKGQVIISPGQACTHIYFVVVGRVQRVGFGSDGHEVVVDDYGPGELFGLEALIWPKSRFPAIAAERSIIKIISLADFETLVCNTSSLAMVLARMMAARLAECHSLLYEFAHRSLHERIICALRRLARNCGEQHELGILLGRPVRQHELARLVGASRSRVSLALARLIADFRLARIDGRYILLDVRPNTTSFPEFDDPRAGWTARIPSARSGMPRRADRTVSSVIGKETNTGRSRTRSSAAVS